MNTKSEMNANAPDGIAKILGHLIPVDLAFSFDF